MASNVKEDLQETNIETGLETQEVKKRLVEYGYNEVPGKESKLLDKTWKAFLGYCAVDA